MQQTDSRKLPAPSAGIGFFPFSEGCVLFRENTHRVWTLNHTAATVWCLLEETADIDGIASELGRLFNIAPEQAGADARQAITMFEREGLLNNIITPDPSLPDSADTNTARILLHTGRTGSGKHCFKFRDHSITVCSPEEEIISSFLEPMAHLAVLSCGGPQTHITLQKQNAAWHIFRNDELFAGDIHEDGVVPALFHLVFEIVCATLENELLFHAAVLGRNGKALVFPAVAGSGKSTLCALACRNGFRYLSDELAAVDTATGRVAAVPLPMSIKSGSTALLEEYYPGFKNRPEHVRSDGKRVRYLTPNHGAVPNTADSYPVAALIFPRYQEDIATQLNPLTKAEAIRRLAATGSSDRALRSHDVRAMIELADNNPCFSLTYSDILSTLPLLEGLIP